MRPETVIRWHRTAFRWYWRHKSRPAGRPAIPPAIIEAIRRIHNENPLWSPERIHYQLIDLGFLDVPCPNTIAKYIPTIRKPPSEEARQSWRTFLSNHAHNTWAMDFFTVPTITFRVLYVLIVISHQRRQIKHIAVTAHPTANWTTQQLREAMPFGDQPKYLIRDNDSIYGRDVVDFITASGIEEVRTAYRSPWQSPIVERVIGTLRRELLDHIIPLDERHLCKLLKEFIEHYYHPIRTRSGLNHKPPLIRASVSQSRPLCDAEMESHPMLGGLYHLYQAKAA